jgi:anti-sigma factor ChrR (cupin superfamily)
MHKAVWIAAFGSMLAGSALAQPADRLQQGDLQWREMFPGVTFAPAYGDWEREAHGKFVTILPGTEIPLHLHSGGYSAVMIAGRMDNIFEGDQRDGLAPGDYFRMDGGRLHAHDCVSEEPCLFYTYSDGAWDIEVPGS